LNVFCNDLLAHGRVTSLPPTLLLMSLLLLLLLPVMVVVVVVLLQLSGVQLSPDGDGTVPLISLGALCAGGWRTRRLNPSGMEVMVREYPHNPGSTLRDAR
jgi:hypothetical protein